MTIDWWGLGLQAVNVLILMWLLGRVFWRPVAGAIALRQQAQQALITEAEAAKSKAEAELEEVTRAREGIDEEREAVLAEANAKAEADRKAALAEAREKADKLMEAARQARDREGEAAKKDQAAQAAELAVDIAAKLLHRLDPRAVLSAFLVLLVEDIAAMPRADRAALLNSECGIELVSAAELDEADKARITKEVGQALGGLPRLTFVTEPDLIAGLELRTAHFVLHDNWKSDLDIILKELRNAA